MRFFPILFLGLALTALAGPDEDWQAVIALDAGPPGKPRSREEAQTMARRQFALQRQAVETFLARHPQDARVFDAKLKLAALIAAQGKLDNNQKVVDDALRLLAELEKTEGVSRDKLADAGFQRVCLYLQSQRESTDRMREAMILAARNYLAKYPGDRRGPRLLVEVASICDESPVEKRRLLEQALILTREDELKNRITDDLKRLEALGKPLAMKLPAIKGGEIDLEKLKGNVVVVIFWSAESPHSLLWMREFRRSWENLPKADLKVVTISLDTDRAALEEKLAAVQANWPTHFDGRGWEGPFVRSLGINALPTVWVVDKKGVLRTINARNNYETIIRQLLRE